MKTLSMKCVRGALAVMGSFCIVGLAHAAQGGGGDLPWAAPLEKLGDSLTGSLAKAIGVVAIAGAGGMLAFGGEMSDFTKRILMVVLALAVMILAGGIMDQLFP